MGWMKEALHRGELKITENNHCPICNPTMASNKVTKLNACERHRWVSKKWFERIFDSNGNIRRGSS
jgi:hypothetical protein